MTTEPTLREQIENAVASVFSDGAWQWARIKAVGS